MIIDKKIILFIIDGLPGGGAEKVVLTLAAAMADRGHDVTIVSLSSQCDYSVPPNIDYIVVEDDYHGMLHRQTEIRRRARQLQHALEKKFNNRHVDLAISNLPKTDRIVVACPWLRDAWLCLHCSIETGQLSHKHGIKRWLKKRQLIRTYSNRKLITVSHALMQDVKNCDIKPLKMVSIYNPFDFESIAKLSKEKCPLEGERFLLHVGRFNSQKRHDRLLQAFQLSAYPGKLVLLGNGSNSDINVVKEQAISLGIMDRVLFVGFEKNPYRYMRAAEALVLSSDYEGFGNVLVEALACETSVVSTDCPDGPSEILTGDLSVGLSELSAISLAKAIRCVIDSPPAISAESLMQFDVQHILNLYLELAD